MDESAFTAARDALIEARRAGRALAAIPPAWVPADLAEAYRLQQAVAVGLGGVRGWKVSALTAAAQREIGVACPIAGPLLAPWVQRSPARQALAALVAPKLECEYAYELAADLPPRAEPYTRAQVAAAIGALHVAIEIVDSRLPPGAPTLLQLGDALNNGAFVIGPAVAGWRELDCATQPIVLRHDGREIARGNGAAILGGDTLGAVVLLANHPPRGPRGLQLGDIVTTGSCTPAIAADGPGKIEADFGPLGRVALQLV